MSHGGKHRVVLTAGLLGVAIVSLWLSWPLPPFDYNLEANFNKTKLGMTREEVVALMGEPRRGGEQYNLSGDIWENSRTVVCLSFDAEDRLRGVLAVPKPHKESYFLRQIMTRLGW
ncbi:MAG TPA: hypothetical protein VG099_12620 [Gemmataceae bacterium]|nr:hypothetical protein [Gemmataceae bacterium]HEV3445482.1 hypothetical protein [Gemmataceae bacterium]